MADPRFNSTSDFLKSLDAAKAATLGAVIDHILTQFPQLTCKISWNVPQIHRGDDYVFGVSAFANHLALAPWSADVIEAFKTRLTADGYVVRKNLFQIPVDWQLDRALLNDLVDARLDELK